MIRSKCLDVREGSGELLYFEWAWVPPPSPLDCKIHSHTIRGRGDDDYADGPESGSGSVGEVAKKAGR